VIGDTGRGIFVRQGVPEFIKARMLPIADIVTPNQFELEYLADRTTSTMEDLVAAIDAVLDSEKMRPAPGDYRISTPVFFHPPRLKGHDCPLRKLD
jgi:Phosphomethylpyrimidine kinase